MGCSDDTRAGTPPVPPPLQPFCLRLHHDASWTHEGAPILHRKLRERFDRSVRYLPEEAKYVVQIGKFQGQIELEEAGFFVRSFDPATGAIALSDGSEESLAVASLGTSERDGALLCRVKRELVAGGLLARFQHAAQSEFMNAVEAGSAGTAVRIAGALQPLPPL